MVKLSMSRSACQRTVTQVTGIALAIVGTISSAFAQNKISDEDLVKALKAGGHAIVMRHTAADPDKGDTNRANFKNLKTQQPLTEQGKASAKAFGDWLEKIGASVGEVLTSRFKALGTGFT